MFAEPRKTQDLEKFENFKKKNEFARNYSAVTNPPPKMKVLLIRVKKLKTRY